MEEQLREFLCANMFDGEDGGETTMKISTLLDEIVSLVTSEYILTKRKSIYIENDDDFFGGGNKKYLDTWLESEHAAKFSDVADNIRSHDRTCKSLGDVWVPHIGGVSCPSDIADCNKCRTTFFNEVLIYIDDNTRYCECCYREVRGNDSP